MSTDELASEIENHRRTTEALRQSEDTVRALLDATTETALLIDTEGKILALNQIAFERLSRLSPRPAGDRAGDMIGRCVFDFFPTGLAEERRARNDAVVRSGLPARFDDQRTGTWMDNTIYPVFNKDGEVVKLAVFSYDITDRKSAEITLQHALRAEQERARRDPLTGVLNHRAIMEELERLAARATDDTTLGVFMIDVDGLKAVNDSHGHVVGDAVLIATADALCRHRAIVGRYGGDEFFALLPGADLRHAQQYADDVKAALAGSEVRDDVTGEVVPVMASIGIAVFPHDAEAVRRILDLADTRMYAAKRQRPMTRDRRGAA